MKKPTKAQKAAVDLVNELVGDDMPGWLFNHVDKIAEHFERYAQSRRQKGTRHDG